MSQLSVRPNKNVPFNVLAESNGYLAVEKPAGVATQPGIKHSHDTLLNGLFAQYGHELQNLGKKRDFGLLHRLDLAVSGVLLVGRTVDAYDYLRGLFERRAIEKNYVCLVHGTLKGKGVISHPIREVRMKGEKTAQIGPHPRAKEARTEFKSMESAGGVSLVECTIPTGRLHQIRVHMASLGHPVVGDFKYGRRTGLDKSLGRGRIALHASSIGFIPPHTSRLIRIQSSLPTDLASMIHGSGRAR